MLSHDLIALVAILFGVPMAELLLPDDGEHVWVIDAAAFEGNGPCSLVGRVDTIELLFGEGGQIGHGGASWKLARTLVGVRGDWRPPRR